MVIKRNGTKEEFNSGKILNAVKKAFAATNEKPCFSSDEAFLEELGVPADEETSVEHIQDVVEAYLMDEGCFKTAKAYILYRERHNQTRDFAKSRESFIATYKKASNTANASIDDNSNVANKNIAVLNSELYKDKNIEVNRYRVMQKLHELHPDFDYKQYVRDIEHHIIYKNDENSTFGFPYCTAVTMYPFLTGGIKGIGGLSAAPKNIDSFCGMFINYVFAVSTQFAGAVATSEFLLCFDWFARLEWGDNYYLKGEISITNENSLRKKTIRSQIYQYFQQIVYSINQPAAARGYQSVFWNVSIFDRPFFDGMFGNFVFPDGSKPQWESLCWIQKEFMRWLNAERLRTILTFPVVSVSLLYKDGVFEDEDMAGFVAKEYSEGNSFFTYISDSVDSLASCCRLKNKIQTHEFNFTNGNIGVMTGSKSVITLNMNRIIQEWFKTIPNYTDHIDPTTKAVAAPNDFILGLLNESFPKYLGVILERVYKYHEAYNELLWDLYNSQLLPAYSAGFIDLNKQYLTIGINGFTASAEFLGFKCNNNEEYSKFCQLVFGTIKEQNAAHKTKKTNFNTECIPAESCGVKLYNADKNDGYWVPNDINLYTSYIFKPYDESVGVLEKFILHGRNYIGEYLDGGSACHVNLDSHPSFSQCKQLLMHAAEVGCSYWTINVPNSECDECGYITKHPITECPKCGSKKISYWDRIIGYMTKISNWSKDRQIEQKKRIYSKPV